MIEQIKQKQFKRIDEESNKIYWNYSAPFYFYKQRINWTKQFLQNNLGIIEKNYSLAKNWNRWFCNVHSAFSDDKYLDDNFLKPINFNFLDINYSKVIKKMLKLNNLNSNFYITDIWYNYYKTNQFQEPHIHETSFTCIHYLSLNKNHSQTKFMDEEVQNKAPKLKTGDLIIFPSWFEHYVEPFEDDEPRITIAFGVNLLF